MEAESAESGGGQFCRRDSHDEEDLQNIFEKKQYRFQWHCSSDDLSHIVAMANSS